MPGSTVQAPPRGASGNGSPFHPFFIPVLFVAGLSLRVASIYQEFWYDEIVSLRIAFVTRGARFIFFPPRLLDTPANQIILRLIGPDVPEWCYRLPSLAAGMAALLLLYLSGRTQDRDVPRMTLLLGTFSYMMIHYSSEARGYALAMCMATASFLALERVREEADGGTVPVILFWASSILGFLAHPTFVLYYAGTLAYSAARASMSMERSGRWNSSQAKAQGPPAVFLFFYLVWYHGQELAEPIPFVPGEVALEFLDFAFGVPGFVSGPWRIFPFVLLIAVLAAGIVRDWNDGRRERCAFLAGSATAACGLFVLLKPIAFFPRYLLVLLPFLLLTTATGLASLRERGIAGQATALAFLLVFLAGNGYHTYRFLEDGKGHCREALLEMAGQTRGAAITVGADNPGRLEPFVWYRQDEIERFTGKRVSLVTREEYFAGTDPEWIMLHAPERQREFPEVLRRPGRTSYRLVRVYPQYGLSGFAWALFRIDNPPGPS